MTNSLTGDEREKRDMALALQTVREVDAAFDNSERLRLGRWVLPNERETTIASFIAKALATVRQEERRAAFSEMFKVLCLHCAEGNEPTGDSAADWYYHDVGAGQEVGCSASKLRIEAAANEAQERANNEPER